MTGLSSSFRMVHLFGKARLRNQMKSYNKLADRLKGFSGTPAGKGPFILILHLSHLPRILLSIPWPRRRCTNAVLQISIPVQHHSVHSERASHRV